MSTKPGLLALAVCLFTASTVRANSAAPDAFYEKVEGNTVTLDHYYRQVCGSPEPVLRRNVATNEVVTFDRGSCGSGDAWDTLVDVCIPAGTYQYGFATLPTCKNTNAQNFIEIKVTQELGACSRPEGVAAPKAYEGSVPWGDEEWCDSGCSTAGIPSLAGAFLLALFLRQRTRPSRA